MVFRDFSGAQAAMTCSTSVRPPARCKTFATPDFRRVPFPAARITTARSLAGISSLILRDQNQFRKCVEVSSSRKVSNQRPQEKEPLPGLPPAYERRE